MKTGKGQIIMVLNNFWLSETKNKIKDLKVADVSAGFKRGGKQTAQIIDQ